MPETHPPIQIAGRSIDWLTKAIAGKPLPPVERWDPPLCGHSGMRIAADGTWFHDDAPIARPAMTRLFSTVLRREDDGSHVLVTPHEKLTVDVDVTPFRAIAMTLKGQGSARRVGFELDSGDAVIVGPDHPLRPAVDGRGPRIAIRHGMEAILARPVYYELAEVALADGSDPPGIWSDRCFFPL